MSDQPVLRRLRYASSSRDDFDRGAPLVSKRFGWTVVCRWLLQIAAYGWISGGVINCLVQIGNGANSPEGLTVAVLIAGVFDVLWAITLGALLLAFSELLYGVACWLAANGAPESGEKPV